MRVKFGPVAALLAAQVLSLTGTRLSLIALPWFVLELTGDPMLTGVTAFLEMLPYVVAKGLGGPFIDRLGARRIAALGELVSVVVIASIPVLHVAGALTIHTLLPVVFITGLVRGPTEAAKQALVPVVASAVRVPLERVTGLVSTADRLATTLGAGVAGGAVGLLGAAPALGLTAATFGLAALVLAAGVPKAKEVGANAAGNYWDALSEGWRHLAGDAFLLGLVVMIAVTNLLDQALIVVMLPVWARETGGGPEMIGLLIAVQSGFAVVGAAVAARFGERMPRLKIYTVAFLIAGAPRFLVLLPGVLPSAIFGTVALSGFAIGFINPIISAVCFERIPRVLLGRITSLIGALAWALMPFSGLLGGASIAAFGLSVSLALAAGLYFAATMLPLMVPGFRAMSGQTEINSDDQRACIDGHRRT